MPLYEYECSACKHRLEKIQKAGARPPRCPECGGTMKRLLSAPAIQFKGSGWYITDYARKGKKGEAGAREDKGVKAEKTGGEDKGVKAEKTGGESKGAAGTKASGAGKKEP